jgi:hypothetical protein
MVKLKVESESKRDRFKRIASARTSRILKDIRLLGNCSNARNYSYTAEDVNKIFSAIEKELKRAKLSFDKPTTEFILD